MLLEGHDWEWSGGWVMVGKGSGVKRVMAGSRNGCVEYWLFRMREYSTNPWVVKSLGAAQEDEPEASDCTWAVLVAWALEAADFGQSLATCLAVPQKRQGLFSKWCCLS